MSEPTSATSHRRRRPPVVTWLTLGGLTFAAFYLARLVLSLSLPRLPLSVPVWYLSLTGAVWGGLGLALAVGLWRGVRAARRAALWSGVAYVGWTWLDGALFVHGELARRGAAASALAGIAGLLALHFLLTRPTVRAYFRETPDD